MVTGPRTRSAREGIRPTTNAAVVELTRAVVQAGADPLGEAFSRIRPACVLRNDPLRHGEIEIADLRRWTRARAASTARACPVNTTPRASRRRVGARFAAPSWRSRRQVIGRLVVA